MDQNLPTIHWGMGEPLPGTPFRIVIPSEPTEGRMVGIAADLPPGVHVDEHTHEVEDQICVVVAGRVGCRVGGVESLIEPGGVAYLPHGVPHELWNPGDEMARLIDFYTPSGIEAMFRRAGADALAAGVATAGGGDYRAARGS